MRNLLGLLCILVLSGAQHDLLAVRPQPVTGKYKVKSIEPREDYHRIVFENSNRTAKIKHLTLDTKYVHVGVERGQVLKLSAEVLAAGSSEIKQVLLYLPKDGSHSPVWMLSRLHPQMKFTGARLLDMHAPQSDYLLF